LKQNRYQRPDVWWGSNWDLGPRTG